MHPSSMENMHKCAAQFPITGRVLDVGAMNVNGTYRALFPNVDYTGVDLSAGNGVDIVLDDPYKLPFDDASFDCVISGQVLEHCEFFWMLFQEMARVMKHGAVMFLIAPSDGPIHQYPVDCYRFLPDSYNALAKYAGLTLLKHWRCEDKPWQDMVGVFRKG